MAHQDPQSRNEAILQNILGEMHDLLPAQSRVEAILQAILNETSYEPAPQSRIEELLLAIKDGGTFDDEARSRNEAILLAKLNGEEYTAEPQSRIEELLIEWANVPSWILKTVSGSVVSISDAIAAPAEALTVDVVAWQEGSGDPSPDNVRPIHGYSAVNVTRCGKNLWNTNDPKAQNGYYERNGTFVPTGVWKSIKFKCSVGMKFIKSGSNWGGNVTYWKDGTFVGGENANRVTIPSGVNEVIFGCQATSQNAQLEIGSTATEYEPYTGNIYTIQLGQEVYGAEVDAVNGVAHVDTGIKEMDENSVWEWQSQYVNSGIITDMLASTAYNGLCNIVPVINHIGRGMLIGSNSRRVYIGKAFLDSLNITSLDDWKALVSNTHLIFTYPLANPFDIQLTPTQVQLLKDNNTLYADTGDLTLTYKAHE